VQRMVRYSANVETNAYVGWWMLGDAALSLVCYLQALIEP